MRRNCRFHGEVITIKNGKYGSMYVPKEESAPKEGKKPSGDNAFDRLREDIERIKDENIKRNRDNLDALYNIDMRNMSPSMKRLFSHYSSEIADARAEISAITSEDGAVAKMLASFKTEIDGEIKEAVSYVQATADSLQASVDIVAKYNDRLAAVEVSASENESKIALIVTDENKINTAKIILALEDDESFAEIVADTINLTGYVQFTDLDNDGGSTVVSGNLITMIMDGSKDDGRSDLESKSKLKFKYINGTDESTFAHIFTSVDGNDSDVTSRYALYIQTNPFENSYGKTARPAIKINAYGNISLESDNGSIYAASQYGYILSEAEFGTRIRAVMTYEDMVLYGISASVYDYVFAGDGIYYGTHKLVDNPYNQ